MRFLPDSVFPDCGLPLVTHRVESGLKIALCWRMWGKLSSLIHRLSFCLWYKPSDRCFSGPHYISLNSFPFSFRKSHISLPNKCNWSQKTNIVNTKRKKYAFILLLELLLYDMKHSSSKSISISPSFFVLDFFKASSELPWHIQEQVTISDAVISWRAWQDLPWKAGGRPDETNTSTRLHALRNMSHAVQFA